ncbi:MAG TPA: isoprenoid biosynthesis glyoxalase ElbB [Candidatus Marinimicrobia bacterium]|jgi:enhancing lycopene biosynthesis protein 2|nr:isoprenoid biosynthesis protein ElbB [Candidatus Neomarinimicrobiota bacterium]MDP6275357.1 isoprenoid biosynthesis glyoxalase ElbB [Candidatus Neomarinimicrobiota bacterium]MDP7329673.1 isoprenoid biosynthesis glyoxalase ElbB [Candidatus Neomarinimicrobiota bacterium]MDP7436289.1 isoprenoid biosynthesis glyoxalase ElbB [Candidatus Neomarinimicrobiota bacterium]HJL75430.1 isoprenoid biosynthesis glyoxalase ElbB [Candidatus Neomarinimicrobiota bacterium]|tara:strand:- start:4736 stop:5392 length:657 start_codon:yes stop_codon:yes gene_type:complete
MPKIGVVLSGCGVNDGSEIHESVITMLELDKAGADMVLMAPNIDQLHVINHYTGTEMDEYRNVLVESARIARGDIKDMAEVSSKDVDALIFPGGFGVAKNLCDYAMAGAECSVNPDVVRLAQEVHKDKKPIGVICISPAMMAKILGDETELTIGFDEQTANDINTMGAKHVTCPVDDIVIDMEKRVVSTPAYMEAKSIKEAATGISKLIAEILNMVAD